MTGQRHALLDEGKQVLASLGLPRAQQNERSVLTLLALLDLTPDKRWSDAQAPLIGITPIMDWIREHYSKEYAPNTRETVRRYTVHQFAEAGIVRMNPDQPDRPVNSPRTVYQVAPEALSLLRTFGTAAWHRDLPVFLAQHESLIAQYARERAQNRVPVEIAPGSRITLSPGDHSELIRAVVEEFAPRFAPRSTLVYVGDTGDRMGYLDAALLAELGVVIDPHGKLPDVVLYDEERRWLILVECVTSHGPIHGKRHAELARLFAEAVPALVYVTAFPNRSAVARYIQEIAWETDVWVADAPSHMVHFDGERYLGPYAQT